MARFVEGLPFHTPLYSPFDLSRRRHDLFGQMLAGTLPEARDRTARTDRRAQNPSGTEDRGAYARHPLLPRGGEPPPPPISLSHVQLRALPRLVPERRQRGPGGLDHPDPHRSAPPPQEPRTQRVPSPCTRNQVVSLQCRKQPVRRRTRQPRPLDYSRKAHRTTLRKQRQDPDRFVQNSNPTHRNTLAFPRRTVYAVHMTTSISHHVRQNNWSEVP